MKRTEVLRGLRTMRFEDVLGRWERGELSQAEAADVLGMSERTFRRWHGRWLDEGASGLADRRVGRRSPRRVKDGDRAAMVALYREMYGDFTVKHFHEQLVKRHDYVLSYTFTRLALQAAGAVKPAPRRSAHRKKRPRRPLVGMMLHQDGSRHDWLGTGEPLDLIATMDDANSELYSLFLTPEEGTASTFRGLNEAIARKGLFCQLYTDRGSHYFLTPEAGERVDKTRRTQVGRALAQLGIEHIAAYSPEARGRGERMFRTLQDRLPKELRLAGIATIAEANRFIAEVYLPEHNRRFAVAPEETGSAFVPAPAKAWRDVLCVQEDRRVGNDNTVRWNGLVLQLPESPLRRHFVRATVRVHHYHDGALAIFLGPRSLARYDANAKLLPRDASRSSRKACGYVDGAKRRPHPHRPSNHKSGQFICCENRSS
jgi:transposase